MNTYFMQKPGLFAAFFGVVALTLLPSCQDEDFGYTTEEIRQEAYNRNFKEIFGEVDPNHTWNTATRASVSVDINFDGAYTVKVYTANPRYPENNAYLVGQFDNVEGGSHTFECDMPATVECAYVGLIDDKGNRMILPAELAMGKAYVEFGSNQTRTVFDGTDPFTYCPSSNYVITTIDDIHTPLQTLPEGVNNTGKVSQNFEYISMGSFEISPIYTITSNKGGRYWGKTDEEKQQFFGERLGVYTYNNDGQIVKENGEIKITWVWHMNRGIFNNDRTALTSGTWYEAHIAATKEWKDMFWFHNVMYDPDNVSAEVRESYCVWDESKNNFKPEYDKIRTLGISLNIPAGTRFGFVLETDHGNVYSNSSYNLDEGNPTGTTPDHIKDTYAATFHANNIMYLAFEDWGYGAGGHDNDFNDLVLKLAPTQGTHAPLIIDKDEEVQSMLYIVACEDLGGTFDWDFNDIVFGIEHVSGQSKTRLKLLAAGGTLPISIKYYGNKRNESTGNIEPTYRDVKFLDLKANDGTKTRSLHAAFGVDDDIPVNVNAKNGVNHDPVYSEEFEVKNPDNFSVLDGAQQFIVRVVYGKKADDTDDDKQTIHLPDFDEKVKVPQAFLVADPNWEWPTENQKISLKYSGFDSWVSNFTDKTTTNWTQTIWGDIREFSTIPSGATNVMQLDGAVTFNGNVATIKLDHTDNRMSRDAIYKLALMLKREAIARFYYNVNGEDTELPAAPNGTVQADKLTTFTLSADIINNIKNSNNDGKLILTFPENVQAENNVILVNWYKDGQLLPSNIEVKSPIYLNFNESAAIVYTTENQESPVTFVSAQPQVLTVDENGVVKAIANTTTAVRVTLSQTSSVHYGPATAYVDVNVNPIYEVHAVCRPAGETNEDNAQFGYPTYKINKGSMFTKDGSGNYTLVTSTINSVNKVYVTEGANITITAPRKEGYSFKWSNGSTANSRTETINNTFTTYIDYTDITKETELLAMDDGGWTVLNYDNYQGAHNLDAVTDGNGYGNSNFGVSDYVDLKNYTVLKLVLKTKESTGAPRFAFNKSNDSIFEIVENGANKEYLHVNHELEKDHNVTIFYVNLKAIKDTQNDVHLNCIKVVWNEQGKVIKLYENPWVKNKNL